MVLIRKSDVSHRSKAIKVIEKALEQGKGNDRVAQFFSEGQSLSGSTANRLYRWS